MKPHEDSLIQIAHLNGHLLAHDVFIEALLRALPADALPPLADALQTCAQAMQKQLLPAPVSEHTVAGFERAVQAMNARVRAVQGKP